MLSYAIRRCPKVYDLSKAKLLFIGSNPSINVDEFFPNADWCKNDITNFFINRFDLNGGFVRDFLYPKHRVQGTSDLKDAPTWVRYWASIRTTAQHLLAKDKGNIIPGVDYALMDIVRCKSQKEQGVTDAINTCASKYLLKTLEISKARVFVALGVKSKDILTKKLSLNWEGNICNIRDRIVVALPHPNSRKTRKIEYNLSTKELLFIQENLKGI